MQGVCVGRGRGVEMRRPPPPLRAGMCCARGARAWTRCWTRTAPRASCTCAASSAARPGRCPPSSQALWRAWGGGSRRRRAAACGVGGDAGTAGPFGSEPVQEMLWWCCPAERWPPLRPGPLCWNQLQMLAKSMWRRPFWPCCWKAQAGPCGSGCPTT